MGQTVADMHDKFSSFLANIEAYAMSVIESSEPQVVKAIQDQLWQGKDGKDQYLKPYAWEDYRQYKLTLNPLGVTDLKLTGSFYHHLKLQILSQNAFSVMSLDPKYPKLLEMYGIDIMTMGEEEIQEFRAERFNPFFVDLMAAYTGAGTSNG